MSIASEITRLQQAKADIKTAIENKGVTVPSDATLDAYDGYIDDIEQGGGGTSLEDKPVIYIDYDGSVVYGYTAEEFAQLTEHPANPDHSGDDIPLTSQGWNWTLSDAQTYVAANGYLVIGQMYITTDGATYIGIDTTKSALDKFTNGGFYLSFSQTKSNGVTIEWGDGNSETVSGTGNKSVLHEYASDGVYTIKMYATDGVLNLINNFMGRYEANDRVLIADAVTFVRIGVVGTGLDRCCGENTISITIPNNIVTIGNGFAIRGYGLKTIIIPRSVTSISASAFYYCANLKFISIPKGATIISTSAFQYCKSLKFVTLPDVMSKLDANCFNNCWALETIVLPNTLTTLGNSALTYCTNLKKIINIPVTSTSIVVTGCWSLEELNLPSGISAIGTASECRSLKHLTIPEGITSLQNGVFRYCNYLERVTIPQSVTTIGNQAFQGCNSLIELNILGNVTLIGQYAFSECFKLTELVLPQSLVTIDVSTFASCYSLKHIVIPNNVTTIGTSAFANCTTVESITIGEKVTSIGNSAFSANTRDRDTLQAIYMLPQNPPSISNSSFSGLGDAFTIYVPQGRLSAYQSATNWTTLASKMVEMTT